MSPKQGVRAAPPAVGTEYELRFASTEAAKGWDQLARHVPGNLRRAFEKIRADPRSLTDPDRHHRLKGALGTGVLNGEEAERWQFEVTSGDRIWYLIDDAGPHGLGHLRGYRAPEGHRLTTLPFDHRPTAARPSGE